MRLVRLGQQPSRVAEDIRAALASLGRGITVVGGVALVGVRPTAVVPQIRSVDAIVVQPRGVLIVLGVDLPDPAMKLEAPLNGPWKADGWALPAPDKAANPATPKLELAERITRHLRPKVPAALPIGTVLAVGPFVDEVDQPPADVAGPVRVLHPTAKHMLAASVSLASAAAPCSIDDARALLKLLAPEVPPLSDEILKAEGFGATSDAVRGTDKMPHPEKTDKMPSPPKQPGRKGESGTGGPGGSGGSGLPSGAATPVVRGNAAARAASAATGAAGATGVSGPPAVPSTTVAPPVSAPGTATGTATPVVASPVQTPQGNAPSALQQQAPPAPQREPGQQTQAPQQKPPHGTPGRAPAQPGQPPAGPQPQQAVQTPQAPPRPSQGPAESPQPTLTGQRPPNTTTQQPGPAPNPAAPQAAQPPQAGPGQQQPGQVPLHPTAPPPQPIEVTTPVPRISAAVPVRKAHGDKHPAVKWLPYGALGLLGVLLVLAVVLAATTGGDEQPAVQAQNVNGMSMVQRAAGTDTQCATHAVGDLQASLQRTGCVNMRRASFETTIDGKTVAVSVAVVTFADTSAATSFKRAADTPGGGSVPDLALETGKWPRPPHFDGTAAYFSGSDGPAVRLVLAAYFDQPSTADDPGLVHAAEAGLTMRMP